MKSRLVGFCVALLPALFVSSVGRADFGQVPAEDLLRLELLRSEREIEKLEAQIINVRGAMERVKISNGEYFLEVSPAVALDLFGLYLLSKPLLSSSHGSTTGYAVAGAGVLAAGVLLHHRLGASMELSAEQFMGLSEQIRILDEECTNRKEFVARVRATLRP